MKTLRLRPGVHYAPIDGGVYLSSARSTFVMRGPAVLFRVIDTCLPLLEDGSDVDDLVAAVGPPASRTMVTHVVATLDSRGLLLHLDRLQVPEPDAAERQRFPEALAYLEAYRDDPYRDFRRIRTARVLLAGPADALGPATRGLVRAGVGQITIATPQPERLSALVARHPEVTLVLDHAAEAPDAAVLFTEDGVPFEAIGALPDGCVAIPVRLGKDLAIVGPATRRTGGVAEVWDRAARWCRLDGDELLVRPSGDLLAGALAGQVAVDALIGLNPGRVHVVHGADLASDAITPASSGDPPFDPPVELTGGMLEPSPAAGERWTDSVSGRWSGLFRVRVPGELPQMPVVITLAEGRTAGFEGCAIGIGGDQETSTEEAGLEALRHHCAGLGRPPHQPSAAAAGVDRTRWLLDGALRLLAQVPGVEHPVEWLGVDDVEARRLWRALEEHELIPVHVLHRPVRGFGWTLAVVRDRGTGALLAGGWGPTLAVAARAALSAAIAANQVRRTVDAGYQGAAPGPGLVPYLHQAHVDDLAAQVRGWLDATGSRLVGRRLARDSGVGALAPWCGLVWLDD